MAQQSNQTVKTFSAGASLTAGYVAAISGANQAILHLTSTSHIIGIVEDDQFNSDGAVSIVIAGTARAICALSVSVGAIVGPQTATAKIVERAIPLTVTSDMGKSVGIALQSGSTNSSI